MLVFLIGIVVGNFIFVDVQPRSFLALGDCGHSCWSVNEITGLLASVGIKHTPGFLPGVIRETEKSIVIKHPSPQANHHYVIFPKKDIKDIADVSAEDKEYLTDALLVIGEIIREQRLTEYQIISNGPDEQLVRYLHVHLMANK